MIGAARRVVRRTLDSGFWHPSSARALIDTRPGRRRTAAGHDPASRLRAAAAWLARAQDVTGDGGVSWGYQLRRGWAPSYPETTGYIVPTLLELATTPGLDGYRDRAARAVEFLLAIQLPDGAFPGGVLSNAPQPSVFNTGQILNGLTAWFEATGDEATLRAARRGGDWLCSVQDDDGAWRRHGYRDYPVTYTAHASCWLAELGVAIDEPRFRDAAGRHLDWVLSQQDRTTGWFERTGFDASEHAARRSTTHTLAYTIWGVAHGGIVLGRMDAVAASRVAAGRVADVVLREGWLPGVLNAAWQPGSRFACLTGNAQMVLAWHRLATLEPDERFARATLTALDRVGAAQSLTQGEPGIRGGIPGSDPITGSYIPNAYPNWAAKFYIDALLATGAVAE